MYLEIHSSWLSSPQTSEGCLVIASSPSFPGGWTRLTLSICAGTQGAPQVQRPMLVRRKSTRSTLTSSPPHRQLLSLEKKTYEPTEGRGKGLVPLGTWLPDAMG